MDALIESRPGPTQVRRLSGTSLRALAGGRAFFGVERALCPAPQAPCPPAATPARRGPCPGESSSKCRHPGAGARGSGRQNLSQRDAALVLDRSTYWYLLALKWGLPARTVAQPAGPPGAAVTQLRRRQRRISPAELRHASETRLSGVGRPGRERYSGSGRSRVTGAARRKAKAGSWPLQRQDKSAPRRVPCPGTVRVWLLYSLWNWRTSTPDVKF